MYVDLTKQEVIDRRQYWWSKCCNSVYREHKDLFYKLYAAYSDLLVKINTGDVQTKEQNNVS